MAKFQTQKKQNFSALFDTLKTYYPEATCSLDFTEPFELVVAVMLSAQCTDERVNRTTKDIFPIYSTPEDFQKIPLEKLEELIHPCGFYQTKAKNIKATATKIVEKFDGKVPEDMDSLMSLPGVGRKSANVIMLEVFHHPQGIAVDTHAKRLCYRLGLSQETDPNKIEQDLLKVLPNSYLFDVNHLLVWHGRNCCTARSPKCATCPLATQCPRNGIS